MRREPRQLRSPVFASSIRRTRRRGSRRPPPRLPTLLFTKPAHSRVSDRKIVARYPDVPRDQVEPGRSPDYHDFTTSSVCRGTGQPPTRSALLTANWRGCEAMRPSPPRARSRRRDRSSVGAAFDQQGPSQPNLYFEELAGSILEHPMPCASWSGFLRLSLVSCPIYLSPATLRTKPLRLHQVWRPAAASEPDVDGSDRDRDERVGQPSTPWLVQPDAAAEPIKAAQRRGLRCARTTPERVRRSRNHKSSRDTNTTAASL